MTASIVLRAIEDAGRTDDIAAFWRLIKLDAVPRSAADEAYRRGALLALRTDIRIVRVTA